MRRTRYDIITEILKLCIIPRKVTEIVYDCNLNFSIVKKYLPPLIKMGMIKEENSLYKITKFGSQTLDTVTPAILLFSACV